jgi:hypothetical protein
MSGVTSSLVSGVGATGSSSGPEDISVSEVGTGATLSAGAAGSGVTSDGSSSNVASDVNVSASAHIAIAGQDTTVAEIIVMHKHFVRYLFFI